MDTTQIGDSQPAANGPDRGTSTQVPTPPDVLIGAGGEPLTLGLAVFMVGALTIGMTFVGVFPAAATGEVIPVAVFTTGLLLLVTTVWGLLRGQSVLTAIFGTVAGLFLSFGVLVMGLYHNWFAITPSAVPSAEAIFFIAFGCWFALLLVPSVKLPVTYTITIALVVVAIALGSAGLLAPSPTLVQAAGGSFLTVSFCLAWLWLNTCTAQVGLKAWPPLGKPLAQAAAPAPQELLKDGALTGDWALDPSRSTVGLRSRSMWGLAPVNGVFSQVSGQGTVSPGGGVSGILTVAAGSVDTRNSRRDKHLRSADFFDSATYRDITFTVDRIRPSGQGVTVSGTLTVRGRTRPLSFEAQVSAAGSGEVLLDAQAQVNRADFGLTWNQMGMASMSSTITVHLVFTRA